MSSQSAYLLFYQRRSVKDEERPLLFSFDTSSKKSDIAIKDGQNNNDDDDGPVRGPAGMAMSDDGDDDFLQAPPSPSSMSSQTDLNKTDLSRLSAWRDGVETESSAESLGVITTDGGGRPDGVFPPSDPMDLN